MSKVLLALFLAFIHAQVFAASASDFGFVVSTEDELEGAQKIEHNRLTGFFQSLESDIRLGVVFGVDRIITIKFSDFESPAIATCDGQNNRDFVRLEDDETILINTSIKEDILDFRTFKNVSEGCSIRTHLLKALETELLKIKYVRDLEQDWSKVERRSLNVCRDERREYGNRWFSENPHFRDLCGILFKISDRRSDMKRHKRKIKNLLYNSAKLEFDPSSFAETDLRRYKICERDYKPTKVLANGTRMKMLGMAIVYMSPGFQTSQAGHVAERYIYCKNDELVDMLFEYTQMTEEELVNARSVYQKHLPFVSDEYISSLNETIYIKVRSHPGSSRMEGYGFHQLYLNRDVAEVWPTVSESEIYEGLQTSLKHYIEQGQNFRNQVRFEPYSLLKNNCTHPIRDRLNKFGGDYEIDDFTGFNPIWIFNFLKKKTADRMIIYPSQRLLRKMEMLESGKSMFWENTTFWSKSSGGREGLGPGFMVFYPEVHGTLKSLILKPAMGAVNIAASVAQVAVGILQLPLKLLSKIPGFKFLERLTGGHNLVYGLRGITLHLPELVGFRLRYPMPTPWTPEELAFVEDVLPNHDPKIVNYLMEKVYQ
tara:strand:+ start:440 stop:2233 length:1794 start_codon:yes stop_codon:yes gene_type:complete